MTELIQDALCSSVKAQSSELFTWMGLTCRYSSGDLRPGGFIYRRANLYKVILNIFTKRFVSLFKLSMATSSASIMPDTEEQKQIMRGTAPQEARHARGILLGIEADQTAKGKPVTTVIVETDDQQKLLVMSA